MTKTNTAELLNAFALSYYSEKAENPLVRDNVIKKLLTDEEYKKMQDLVGSSLDFFAHELKSQKPDKHEIVDHIVKNNLIPMTATSLVFAENALNNDIRLGLEQLVIIGSGLNTLGFRKQEMLKNCKVFDVDTPKNKRDKLDRIDRAKLEIPSNLYYVSCDLSTESIGKKLADFGFDSGKKTFFIWLGRLFHYDKPTVDKVISDISTISANGSTLVCDFGDEFLFASNSPRVQRMLEMAKSTGEPIVNSYSYEAMESLMDKYGFLIYEWLTPADIQKNIIDAQGSDLKAFERIEFILAVKNTKENT